MTKSELLQALADKLGKTRKEAGEILEAVVGLAYATTKKKGIHYSRFGQLLKKTAQQEWVETPQPANQYKFRLRKSSNSRPLQAKEAIL